ncbi:MAG: LysR family transcriptional regulator [Gammaproteobacteria bacterium]
MVDLLHLRILLALKQRGTLIAAAESLHVTQSALTHQIKNLEHRLGVTLWNKQGRTLMLTQAGKYLAEVAESVLNTVESAEKHVGLLARGKTGKLVLGIECHACYEWFRRILQPYLHAWPNLEVEVTSRHRADALNAIKQYKLDALLTSDPVLNGLVSYQSLFDFELLLFVSKRHRLAQYSEIAPEELRHEIVLTYPAERERLDMFRKVLQPFNVEPLAHKTVEETDVMLQMAASERGVCLLPEWLLTAQASDQGLTGLRIKDLTLGKTMYLATRTEDTELDYIQWLVKHAAEFATRQ